MLLTPIIPKGDAINFFSGKVFLGMVSDLEYVADHAINIVQAFVDNMNMHPSLGVASHNE